MIYMKSITERITSIVYHTTTIGNCLDILKSNRLDLTTNIGTDADRRSKEFYYFSVSRVKYGGYARSLNKSNIANLVLDGDLFNQRYKGIQVDYWGQSFRKNVSSEMKLRNDENEERIVTDDPFISNAIKYIKEIHICYTDKPITEDKAWEVYFNHPQQFEMDKIISIGENMGIDIYIYYNPKDYIIHNKKNALSKKSYGSNLKAVVDLAYSKSWKDFNSIKSNDRYNTLRRIIYNYYDYEDISYYPFPDFKRSLNIDIHNLRTKDGGKLLISDFTQAMKKYNVRTLEDLLIKIAEKFRDEIQS